MAGQLSGARWTMSPRRPSDRGFDVQGSKLLTSVVVFLFILNVVFIFPVRCQCGIVLSEYFGIQTYFINAFIIFHFILAFK